MPPKKNKKRKDDDDDIPDHQEKLAALLKKAEMKQNKDEQPNAQHLYSNKKKEVFDYDFSNQKVLYNLKDPVHKPKQQPVLTEQEKKILSERLQKQKQEKQIKKKQKEQKKKIRQMQVDELKQNQKKQKEQENKKQEEVQKIKNEMTGPSNGKWIPIILLGLLVIMGVLQYQKQIYSRLNKFKLNSEDVNYYEVLQVDSGVTDKQLKQKYKRLVLKYHPDKNPHCKECPQKFNNIMKAWQIIGSPQKRKHYDQNSGYITQIKSQSLTLTPQNYNQHIDNSKSLWIIQVYDSTNQYCHFFASFWEDVVKQYGDFIKFGRIDVWTQSNMISYLPYKFGVFPGLYYVHKGQVQMCTVDFQRPHMSIKKCIQNNYKQNLFTTINSLENIQHSQQKISIIFPNSFTIGSRIKILHKKYENYFMFYILTSQNKTLKSNQVLALTANGQKLFQLISQARQNYHKYQNFLESLVIQQSTICQLIQNCQDQACLILLQNQYQHDIKVPNQQKGQQRPVYYISTSQFKKQIQHLKNVTGLHQAFEIGLYQNGRIDLGYYSDVNILNIQEGEPFYLICKHVSWSQKVMSFFNYFLQQNQKPDQVQTNET